MSDMGWWYSQSGQIESDHYKFEPDPTRSVAIPGRWWAKHWVERSEATENLYSRSVKTVSRREREDGTLVFLQLYIGKTVNLPRASTGQLHGPRVELWMVEMAVTYCPSKTLLPARVKWFGWGKCGSRPGFLTARTPREGNGGVWRVILPFATWRKQLGPIAARFLAAIPAWPTFSRAPPT